MTQNIVSPQLVQPYSFFQNYLTPYLEFIKKFDASCFEEGEIGQELPFFPI